MANPALKNGYISIATELVEKFATLSIPSSEMRLIWVVWRKTWGWKIGNRHKDWDWISLSQFEKLTTMKHGNVAKSLKSLVVKRILLKNTNYQYKFNQNYDEWVVVKRIPPVVKRILGSSQTHTKIGSQTHTNKRNKETNTKENSKTKVLQDIKSNKKNMKIYEEPSIDLETGEIIEIKPTKKYPNSQRVFSLFKDIFGKYPANWKINKTQLQSAENLFTERGADQILKALQFYKENKEEEFCPVINSPYDLDSKWAKLINFKIRQ